MLLSVARRVNGAGCHRWRVLLNQTPPRCPAPHLWLAIAYLMIVNSHIVRVIPLSISSRILFRVGWLADQLEDSSRLTLPLELGICGATVGILYSFAIYICVTTVISLLVNCICIFETSLKISETMSSDEDRAKEILKGFKLYPSLVMWTDGLVCYL